MTMSPGPGHGAGADVGHDGGDDAEERDEEEDGEQDVIKQDQQLGQTHLQWLRMSWDLDPGILLVDIWTDSGTELKFHK